jgi:hypothetical protein
MKAVRFLKRVGPYNPGEVAGFEDQESDNLIELGAAVPYKAEGESKPKGNGGGKGDRKPPKDKQQKGSRVEK